MTGMLHPCAVESPVKIWVVISIRRVGVIGVDRSIHSAQGNTVDIASVDTKSDDTPSELVHDHEHPVAIQKNGVTPEQINAPEAILCIPNEGQP